MKKKIVILFALLLSLPVLPGCGDMLDLDTDGRVEIKDIFSTLYRTKEYFDGCYATVPQIGFTYDATNTPLASFSDEAHDANDHRDGAVTGWYKGRTSFTYNPLTEGYVDTWQNSFKGIRKCNSFLKYIQDPEIATYPFNEEQKAGWIAQIRVLRAYFYLMLIKRYGGVPLIATPYEEDHDYSKDVRAGFAECVDFILADCDAALATALPTSSDYGFRWDRTNEEMRKHMTRGTAWAIKSEAALYAASPLWYTAGSPYTWAKAAEITKEALDQCLANGFELYRGTPSPTEAQNGFAYYFINRSDVTRGWDKESILDYSGWRTNVWKWAALPTTANSEKAGAGPTQELIDAFETADGQPVLDLSKPYKDDTHLQPNYNPANTVYDPANPYENRDPRFYASIYYNGAVRYLDNPDGMKVETFVGGNCGISQSVTDSRFTRTGYYLRKFNYWRSDVNNDSDGLIRAFRLAELYLNFAEAAYQAYTPDTPVESGSGTPMSARDAVNVVRDRAGMPEIPAGLSAEAFGLRYRNERRIEFAFEEHRFFDVRRWKILGETDRYVTGMQIERASDGALTYRRIGMPERPTYTDKYLRYPIREDEVNKMFQWTGTNWQNPGW